MRGSMMIFSSIWLSAFSTVLLAQSAAEPAAGVQLASAVSRARQLPADDAIPDWARQPRSKTYEVLEQRIEPDYPGIPLQQVLQQLSDDFEIPIYAEQHALDSLGINSDAPITLQLPPVALRQALKYMLEPLGLSYRIDGDVLLISSKERINARPSFGVYDLTRIAATEADAAALAKIAANSIRNIEPRAWKESGWYLETQRGTVIVSASEMAHGEIKQMLANLAQSLRTTSETPGSPGAEGAN